MNVNESIRPTVAAKHRRADAQRNIDRLIVAAREAFTEHGANASLDDIARQAGVGPGTLYRHFPTRQALIEAVYRDGVASLCATGDRLRETEPPAEAFVDWLRAFAAYVAQKRGLASSLMATIGKDSPLFAEVHAMITATGGALLDRAKEAGAIRPDVALADVIKLVSALSQAGEQSTEGAALSDRLLLLALDGLRATPSR